MSAVLFVQERKDCRHQSKKNNFDDVYKHRPWPGCSTDRTTDEGWAATKRLLYVDPHDDRRRLMVMLSGGGGGGTQLSKFQRSMHHMAAANSERMRATIQQIRRGGVGQAYAYLDSGGV